MANIYFVILRNHATAKSKHRLFSGILHVLVPVMNTLSSRPCLSRFSYGVGPLHDRGSLQEHCCAKMISDHVTLKMANGTKMPSVHVRATMAYVRASTTHSNVPIFFFSACLSFHVPYLPFCLIYFLLYIVSFFSSLFLSLLTFLYFSITVSYFSFLC
jgi:hypothetical protein